MGLHPSPPNDFGGGGAGVGRGATTPKGKGSSPPLHPQRSGWLLCSEWSNHLNYIYELVSHLSMIVEVVGPSDHLNQLLGMTDHIEGDLNTLLPNLLFIILFSLKSYVARFSVYFVHA